DGLVQPRVAAGARRPHPDRRHPAGLDRADAGAGHHRGEHCVARGFLRGLRPARGRGDAPGRGPRAPGPRPARRRDVNADGGDQGSAPSARPSTRPPSGGSGDAPSEGTPSAVLSPDGGPGLDGRAEPAPDGTGPDGTAPDGTESPGEYEEREHAEARRLHPLTFVVGAVRELLALVAAGATGLMVGGMSIAFYFAVAGLTFGLLFHAVGWFTFTYVMYG